MKKNIVIMFVTFSIVLNVVFFLAWGINVIKNQVNSKKLFNNDQISFKKPCPMHEKIGVDDQQWQQIRPILMRFTDESKSVNDSILQYRLQLIEMLAQDSVDKEAVAALQDKVLLMQKRLQDMVIEQILSEKDILSSQQRGKLFLLLRTGDLAQRGEGCLRHGYGESSKVTSDGNGCCVD